MPSVRAMRLASEEIRGGRESQACFNALGAGDEARERINSFDELICYQVSMPSVRAMRLASRPSEPAGAGPGEAFQCPRCGGDEAREPPM